ncbi:restriction endonuclease subunit S [Nocardioides sp.]|uniref:restriction endonuclease subunit S n=1 Tax=Nocardioides sp. TaxID=35761 RepID=UPI003D6A7C0E
MSRANTKELVGAASVVLDRYPRLMLSDLTYGITLTEVALPKFVVHVLSSGPVRAQIMAAAKGSSPSMQKVSQRDIHELEIALPPVEEQHAIAAYIDRETAGIDTLIEEQQRLIEMLRERRQAVVDDATAGLGETAVPLRRALVFLTSGSRGWGDYYADDGERFLRIGNLPRTDLTVRGEIQFVDLPDDVIEGSRTRLREGDLLFSITAYLGSVAVVDDDDWVDGYVSQHVALCRLDRERLDPRFVGWVMLSTDGQHQLKQGAAGGTKVQLALDDIRSLVAPMPPLDEQRRITAYLEEQTTRIDQLVAETERFIELSKERRAALITAAVTGQIDVRETA